MDKSIFITGATGLLGKMYTEHFLQQGYQVIFTSSQKKNIDQMYQCFSQYEQSKKLIGCLVDLMQDEYLDIIQEFLEKFQLNPNYLINNARNIEFLKIDNYKHVEKEKWLGEYYLDVIVPYQLTILLLERKNSQIKSIVNISSMYGMIPPNPSLYDSPLKESVIHYGVSKAAFIQLTKELAVRFAKQNIRINSISYGGVEGRAGKAFKERYAKLCPMQRMLNQADIIGHVEYLCSEMSSGMTGHNLVVDGGFSTW